MVSSDSELDYPPLWYPPSVRSWKPVRWDLINRHFQHWNVFIVTVWVIIHTININVQTQIMEQSNHVEYRDSFVLPVSRTGTAMEEWFNFIRLRNIRPEFRTKFSSEFVQNFVPNFVRKFRPEFHPEFCTKFR